MVGEARRHRGRHPERPVDPQEVIVSKVQPQGRLEVGQFLGEPIGEPSEPAHLHPHREVRLLHIEGRDVGRIGASNDGGRRGPDYLSRQRALTLTTSNAIYADNANAIQTYTGSSIEISDRQYHQHQHTN